MSLFQHVFGDAKPMIGMVHLGALPGAPLYDAQAGLAGPVETARADLHPLQGAGFDAAMLGNENDRPYEPKVDVASTATMAFVVRRLRDEIVALAAATGAAVVREHRREAAS
jgi:predicted TIM-barrel enzyme